MKRILLTIIVLLSALSLPAQWKTYLSYYEPTEIEQASGGVFYVLASGGLYSYNTTDQQLVTYDKTTVLSDCGISHIAWCQAAQRLVIVYDNYNIDLLSPNGDVVNMTTYKDVSLTMEKTVYSIDISGKYAYLSTAFGILQVNVADAEFTNTFTLGFRVDYSYTDGTYLYAASSTNGLYRGLLSANLLDPSQWQRTANYTARPKTMDPDLLAIVSTLSPGGPKYNHFGTLNFKYNKLYSVGGGFNIANDMFYPGCVQVLQGSEWTIYEDDIQSKTGHQFIDISAVDVDPNNQANVYAGGRSGLYLFTDGKFVKEFTYENSPLQGAATVSATNKDYTIVQGLCFGQDGHLWAANSLSATTSLLEYNPSTEEWTAHHKTALTKSSRSWWNMTNLMFDSSNRLWICNNDFDTPAFAYYSPNSDNAVAYTTFINEDGTTVSVNYVRCVAEDNDHNIWIGTNQGPLMLTAGNITSGSSILTQVKVPRNDGTNLADYLLNGTDIMAIVVDAYNRKWFATSGAGIYLINSDNITQLQHFTASNSPLLSDNIESMALNTATGELYIGTDKGLCSYDTGSLPNNSGGMTKDNVYAYPNPVRPGYKGAITITGLDEDASVKITTSNGTLVNEGTASGGQYRWYGLDKEGKRVASGIYMVEVATAEGEKGVVCKIAIVN